MFWLGNRNYLNTSSSFVTLLVLYYNFATYALKKRISMILVINDNCCEK